MLYYFLTWITVLASVLVPLLLCCLFSLCLINTVARGHLLSPWCHSVPACVLNLMCSRWFPLVQELAPWSVVTALLLINEAKPALKALAFTILSHRYTVPQSHVLCLLLVWVLLSVPGVWLGCFC